MDHAPLTMRVRGGKGGAFGPTPFMPRRKAVVVAQDPSRSDRLGRDGGGHAHVHLRAARAYVHAHVPHATDSHPSSRVATLLRSAAVEKHSR